MAFNAIRLRKIIKRIYVLSAVENELAQTKGIILAKFYADQMKRKHLDDQVDNDEISVQEWSLKTDVFDALIEKTKEILDEIEVKIADMESERMNLETQLNNYEDDDITRAMNSIGVWN